MFIKSNKWIEVEGYKGTNRNMKCIHEYNGVRHEKQYEMGKTFKAPVSDNQIKLCEYGGFHFCLELKDVFAWYPLMRGSRFFKVKCLVREKDYVDLTNSLKNKPMFAFYDYSSNSKMVAKQITFVEEIGFDILKEYLPDNIKKYIDTQEDLCTDNLISVAIKKILKNNIPADYDNPFKKIRTELVSLFENSKYATAENIPGIERVCKTIPAFYLLYAQDYLSEKEMLQKFMEYAFHNIK